MKCGKMRILLLLPAALAFLSCGGTEKGDSTAAVSDAADFVSMERTGSMDLSFARQFTVDDYGACRLISIPESRQKFLVVPADQAVPANVPDDVTVLAGAPERTYLVSSSVGDDLATIGALDHVTLSGVREDNWYIPAIREAMENGSIAYAGKYSAPDYELIHSSGCDLALENTMILHSPAVSEKLESLGIPVMVERSSYEESPFGRMEWIRLFGALYGKEEEADRWFQGEMADLEPLLRKEKTGRTAAFFSVTSNGQVTVHKPGSYIASLMELAGGSYIFTDLPGSSDNALSTLHLSFEDFYAGAKDADILIYNSAIEGELKSREDLLAENALFADFRAYQNGEVYTTTQDCFQRTTATGTFLRDLRAVFEGNDADLTFLQKLS